MAARFNVKETCSAWLRLALNRFTVLGTLIILIGIAGGDPFEDFLLGRTVNVSLAWEAFVTNLGAILDNGFVRLALVGLGLFLLQRGAVAVVRADNERAKESAESAAALVDRDGGNRRQIVGEVRELRRLCTWHTAQKGEQMEIDRPACELKMDDDLSVLIGAKILAVGVPRGAGLEGGGFGICFETPGRTPQLALFAFNEQGLWLDRCHDLPP